MVGLGLEARALGMAVPSPGFIVFSPLTLEVSFGMLSWLTPVPRVHPFRTGFLIQWHLIRIRIQFNLLKSFFFSEEYNLTWELIYCLFLYPLLYFHFYICFGHMYVVVKGLNVRVPYMDTRILQVFWSLLLSYLLSIWASLWSDGVGRHLSLNHFWSLAVPFKGFLSGLFYYLSVCLIFLPSLLYGIRGMYHHVAWGTEFRPSCY